MSFLSSLKALFRDRTAGFLDEVKKEVVMQARAEVRKIQRSIRYTAASVILLSAALIFFLCGLVFFFIEYLFLSKTISFLIGGLVLLIVWIIIRTIRGMEVSMAEKRKNKDWTD